jgi:siroheme synthase-like protein
LLVDGRRAVVVGAGTVAAHKARRLLEAGAIVTIVAPEATDIVRQWASTDEVRWVAREFVDADLDDAEIVLTATGDPTVDGRVARSAVSRGIAVNSADDPEHCTFFMMAEVVRGPILVAVSTGGSSPALAAYLRARLDSILEAELADLATIISDVRADVHESGHTTMDLPWSTAIDDEVLELVVAGDATGADHRLRERLGVAAR